MGMVKKISVNPLTVPSSNITSRRIPTDNFPLFTKGDSPDGIAAYVVKMTKVGYDMSNFRYDELAHPLVPIDLSRGKRENSSEAFEHASSF